MRRFGTQYGGWVLPNVINMREDDIALCVGAGEDVSFDLQLQDMTKCNVVVIDPTHRAIKHWDEVKQYYESGGKTWFSGDIQKDYR